MIKFSEPFRSPAWVWKLLKNKSHVSQSSGRGESWQGKPLPCLSRMRGQRKGKFPTNSHSSTRGKFRLLQEAPSDYTQPQWPLPSPLPPGGHTPLPPLSCHRLMAQTHASEPEARVQILTLLTVCCMTFIKPSALLTGKTTVPTPRPLTQPR